MINRTIHVCLKIPDLFLVLNMISHSFTALTREISRSKLEINLVFPRTMYYSLCNITYCDKIFCQGLNKYVLEIASVRRLIFDDVRNRFRRLIFDDVR